MAQDIEEYDSNYAQPQWYLGIRGQDVTAYDPASGSYYQAVYVAYRYSGTPGEAHLDTGDIITRVDGNRVSNMNQLRAAIGFSSGVVSLRVRDVRTGQFVNLNGVQLIDPPNPGGGGGGGPGGGP